PRELVCNLPAAPLSLDPTYASDGPSFALALNTFVGITRLDESNRPVPAMAQSWRVSPDGLVYRFTLREARWSNGLPVTAGDFVFAWLRALKPGEQGPRTQLLFALANAEAYHKGAILDPAQVGVKAIDARTLEVRLAKPAPYFLSLCALPPFFPLCRKVVEAAPQGWSLNPKTAVSNGPFCLASYRARQRITLTVNPYYWQKSTPRLQSITFTWLDQEKAAVCYRAGLIHVLLNPKPGLAGKEVAGISPRLTYLVFNLKKPPFDQQLLREVVAIAVDRHAFIEAVKDEIPAFALVPPGFPDAAPGKDFRAAGGGMLLSDRDLNLARRYLVLAGYPNGEGLPELPLLFVPNQRNEKLVQIVAANLAEIGLRVVPTPVKWNELERRLTSGDFALARLGWTAEYPDAQSLLALFTGDSPANLGGYRNEAFDQALAEAASTMDPARRMAALHEAEEILLADLPILPISFARITYLLQPELMDVVCGTYGTPLFYRAYFAAY
ncbi:MAG: peptide ABC transporter substrate-binding protein, partial [Firmicutes bacterium]|nr:peptide ABC transporter substrate-binding protein [Bacillota bacterium]